MYQAKSGVKIFSLYWGGGPRQKFFSQSEHVSSQIWGQKFFPLLRPGTFPDLDLATPPPTQTWTWGPPWTWTWEPPYLDLGPPQPGPGPGTPATQTLIWDPPYMDLRPGLVMISVLVPSPFPVDRYTDRCQNITFPSYYVRGR